VKNTHKKMLSFPLNITGAVLKTMYIAWDMEYCVSLHVEARNSEFTTKVSELCT